jgi:very-short-patch-repair endonuclease
VRVFFTDVCSFCQTEFVYPVTYYSAPRRLYCTPSCARKAYAAYRLGNPEKKAAWLAKTFSEEAKIKRGRSLRRFYKTHPEAVEKQRRVSSERLLTIFAKDPQEPKRRGKKVSKSLKVYFANPRNREKQSRRLRKFNDEHPEAGIEHGKKLKKLYRESAEIKRKWKATHGKHPNKLEKRMMSLLNELDLRYRFQDSICGYFPDFVLQKYPVIVEVDGEYWHKVVSGQERDRMKARAWRKEGYSVLHFWEKNVLRNSEKVKSAILRKVCSLTKEKVRVRLAAR